jgi:nucleotide-binding universal stress UspA family protein
MLPIRTILHPTDFSPQAGYAFQVACALARDYTARLIVLHVKPPDVVYGEGYIIPPDPAPVRKDLLAQLDRLQPPGPDIRVDRALADGDPVQEILHTARETHADLIVMGTHGRTGMGRILMGSVAEGVLRKAPCPVLTVKVPPPTAPPPDGDLAQPVAAALGPSR